jgi:hypothetical protein
MLIINERDGGMGKGRKVGSNKIKAGIIYYQGCASENFK